MGLLVALLPLAACDGGDVAAVDDRCAPGGVRAAALAQDPALRAPPSALEERSRTDSAATYDEIETRECSDERLFLDLAPVAEPERGLTAFREHLVSNDWTVTVVDAELLALEARKTVGSGLEATVAGNYDEDREIFRVFAEIAAARQE